MTRLFLVILLLLLAAGGCAAGREHSYETISPRIMNGPKGAGLVVITVHDERTEVRSGAEDPDFVGLSRGGYGNPFDVSTKSGAPLANDLARAIERGMNQARYHVRVVLVAHDKDPAQVVANLSRDGARALLLLRLHNLKSDTYTSTALHYQLEALVVDAQRRILGRAKLEGNENLGGNTWNPGAHADKVVPVAVEQKLQFLLNDPQIVQALQDALSAALQARL